MSIAHNTVKPIADTAPSGPAPDRELLRQYAQRRDESAFRALVDRHLALVYSAARRRLGGDAHSAADVTQQVFTALARQAAKLPDGVVLPAWLYATTRHLSANWVRGEQSRRARERAAHCMNEVNTAASAETDWEGLRPVLDPVIDGLPEPERSAVLLRFFSRQSYAEIGAQLRVSEDAARMRVDRALEKLRAALVSRGVPSTAAVLGGLLTRNAVVSAPAGMATLVASAALGSVSSMALLLAFMSSHKLILGLSAALVAGVAGFASLPRVETSSPVNTPQLAPMASVSVERAPTAVQPATAVETRQAASPRPQPTAPTSSQRERDKGVASSVERKIDRLDLLVGLTPQQKTHVGALFAKESAALELIPMAERGEKGQDIRVATRDAVRAALSEPQRRKYDVSPQSAGGGLAADPAMMVTRLDQTVTLTTEQKQKATEILWDDLIEQVAALPPDQQLRGFLWHNRVRDRLRILLTPEQKARFDQTPPYRSNR
jgi:RNA polymerase sigma factor (sigma-70 family)